MKEVIYYKFKKGIGAYLWLVFDIAALAFLFCGIWHYPYCASWWQCILLFVIFGAHLGLWFYKYATDNEMAVITDDSIKIDHNNPLKWDDVAYAEEIMVDCCGLKKVISLVPHDGIDYKYNWLQRHNAGFTAFSIPLYGIISPEDEEKITKIIEKKIGLKSNKTEKKKSEKNSKPTKAKQPTGGRKKK